MDSEARINVLFASSEVAPLAKTGGLGDVSFELPKTLANMGVDIRIVMPAYHDTLDLIQKKYKHTATKTIHLRKGAKPISLIETTLPQTNITLWLVNAAGFSDRHGGPYSDPQGVIWPDNAQRFGLFCDAITAIALGHNALDWQPDIVHCNDWHTGLVPAQLSLHEDTPATVFTVHNISYQGLFSYETFLNLGLDHSLWRFDALEFHNQLSFIKGGLMFADWVNTVSPQYAKELTRPEFGHGLEDIFCFRKKSFNGISNGIDLNEWNPATDPTIKQKFSAHSLEKKKNNTCDLQKKFNLAQDSSCCVLGWVGRLTEQKGVDSLLNNLANIIKLPIQLILLGSGDKQYEQALSVWSKRYPEKIAVQIGYDEIHAHQIIAGAHFFLMPSVFEPCGLTQMYSQRYGAIPIARRVGGLVDTVVNINASTLSKRSATGIVYKGSGKNSLLLAIKSAIKLKKNTTDYQAVQVNAMGKDFSWQHSAQQYPHIYRKIDRSKRGGNPPKNHGTNIAAPVNRPRLKSSRAEFACSSG